MNLITVIPLTRSKVAPTLSYFTAGEVPVGAVVSVPLRSKSIFAIVIGSRPAEDLKSEIRGASYEIRKLGPVKASAFFPASFMEACASLADFYATNTGTIVNALVADAILEQANKIPPPLPVQASFIAGSAGAPLPDETYAVQGDDADRVSAWRSLIRQEFARKRSVAFHAPSVEDARQLTAALEKGIEGYIFLLYAGLTPKKIVETWKKIADTDHPVVVVATGSFSVLPRADIETVVIERENGRGWISPRAPYIDLRHALETIARRAHRTVYLSDSLLRTETLKRLDDDTITAGSPFKWRSVSTAKDTLVDMKQGIRSGEKEEGRMEEKKEDENEKGRGTTGAEKPAFRVLSTELEDLIRRNHEESSHLFIMTARRGTSTATVCADCETLVTCSQCSAPMVLHGPKEGAAADGPRSKNYFMCHRCGARQGADLACANCGSWRLTPLGIGIDKVREEIAAKFPEIAISKIDADATKTESQIAEALEKFTGKPGSVLIGTEMALPYLSDKLDHIAVASMDSLFALPDFRIEERIMYALVRLRGLAMHSILVQTRRAEERVFEYGLKGNLSDFHRVALEGRKRFNYPPFSTLIKITLEGDKEEIAANMGELQAHLAPHEIDVFPAFTATVRGASIIHGLIKLDPHHWPEPELLAKLRSLPPGVSVKVNPESLL